MKFNLNKTKIEIREEIKALRERNKTERNSLEYDTNLREIDAYVTCLKIIEENLIND